MNNYAKKKRKALPFLFKLPKNNKHNQIKKVAILYYYTLSIKLSPSSLWIPTRFLIIFCYFVVFIPFMLLSRHSYSLQMKLYRPLSFRTFFIEANVLTHLFDMFLQQIYMVVQIFDSLFKFIS